MRKRRRDLRPDELDLWNRVARTTSPLHSKWIPASDAPEEEGLDQSLPRPQADLSGFRIGGRRPDTALPDSVRQSPPGRSEQPLLRMDAKAHARMKRGKLPVEGRIDLHGLTLADARPRLVSFILSSHARGKRLVLIITGKGRDRDEGDPVPMRKGQLKHLVPQWLSADPLRGVMLQVTEAHRRHGGSGAFYAYLRRK